MRDIKPKMLSDFLGLATVNRGSVVFDSERISIQEFISVFCFERYSIGFQNFYRSSTSESNLRYNKDQGGDIHAEDYAELRECLEELQFMNQQYLLFKNKKKTLRTKTRNFYKFYENCVEKKNLLEKIKTNESGDSVHGKNADLVKRIKLVEKCGRVLQTRPAQVDSLLSDDFGAPGETFDLSLFQNVMAVVCEQSTAC